MPRLHLLALLVLGACISHERRPLVPADELLAERARTLDGLRLEHARPGDAETAMVFDPADGLGEAEVVAVALTLNPDLRARRAAIGEAEALLLQAGLWPNPSLGVAYRPGLDGASGAAVDADLLFDLLRPGERAAREAAAEAQLEGVRAEVLADEWRIAAEARQARLALLAADEMLRLFGQEAGLRDEALASIRARLELGEATALELALVELDRAGVQREKREGEAERERARRELNEVLGLPPDHALRLSGALAFALSDDLGDEDLDRLLVDSAGLRARQAAFDVAEEELQLALTGQWPVLALGAAYEKELGGDESGGPAASLELPLFDRNQGAIAEKHAARERLRQEYAAALHEARARAFAARDELRRARLEVELQEREALPAMERAQALFAAAFAARELTLTEWLAARTRALETERAFLEALVRHAGALIELESVLGTPPRGGESRP